MGFNSGLTRLLQNLHSVSFQPFRGRLECVLWIIVLLRYPTALEFKVTNTAELIVPSIMVSCPGPEAEKQTHHTTTMFDHWYDAVLMECCVTFTSDAKSSTFD